MCHWYMKLVPAQPCDPNLPCALCQDAPAAAAIAATEMQYSDIAVRH